jgi:hypothetical protein
VKAIFFLGVVNLKNQIKSSPRSISAIFYLFLFGSLSLSIYLLTKVPSQILRKQAPNWLVPFASVIFLFLLVTSAISALKRPPIPIQPADVNFLFATPVNPKLVVLSRSILSQLKLGVLSISLFWLLFLLNHHYNLSFSKIGLGISFLSLMIIIGIISFFKYFLFLLAYKSGTLKYLKQIFRAILIILTIYLIGQAVAFGPIGSKELISIIHEFRRHIPAIVWLIKPLFSVFQPSNYPILALISQLGVLILLIGLTLFLAQDYYEPLSLSAFEIGEIYEMIQSGDVSAIMVLSSKRSEAPTFPHLTFLKGEWAFFWRRLAELAKSFVYLKLLSSLGLSFFIVLAIVVLSPKYWWIGIMATISLSNMTLLSSGLRQETALPFFATIPGGKKSKLLAVSLYPYILTIVTQAISWLPIYIFAPIPRGAIFILLIMLIPWSFASSISNSFAHLIVTPTFNNLALQIIIQYLAHLIVIIPAALIGILCFKIGGLSFLYVGIFIGLIVGCLLLFEITSRRL